VVEYYIEIARLVREIGGATMIVGGNMVVAMVLLIVTHVYFRLKGHW